MGICIDVHQKDLGQFLKTKQSFVGLLVIFLKVASNRMSSKQNSLCQVAMDCGRI